MGVVVAYLEVLVLCRTHLRGHHTLSEFPVKSLKLRRVRSILRYMKTHLDYLRFHCIDVHHHGHERICDLGLRVENRLRLVGCGPLGETLSA